MKKKKSKHKSPDSKNSDSPNIEESSDKLRRKPLAKWKTWLFKFVIAFVFPILFFISLELCLALAEIGSPSGFYVSSKQNGERVFLSNQHFMRQYFGSHIARGSLPFSIPKKKPESTVRIFLLGASAAQGDPDPAYGISRQLEMMLKEQCPDQNIEVHNVAITAINSHVVLPIMRACSDMAPDLFIIYLGNNEVVGPYGAGTAFSSQVKFHWLISLQTNLRASRCGQWVSKNFKMADSAPKEWAGMEMFLNNPVTQDDARMQTVYSHYRNNLRSMFRIGVNENVPVLISTVAVNLKHNAPFGSRHKPNLKEQELETWEAHYEQGIEKQKQGQGDQALSYYHEALKVDDQYADLHFRMATCYLQTNQIELAKFAYEKARDLDVFRFRADSTINQIIQETAAEFEEVAFIDGRKTVKKNSPDGIPGTELFYEHVHYNFSGNYLMAKTLNPAVLENLEIQKGIKPRSREILSEAEIKKRLAYTPWDQLKIARFNLERLEKPPFTSQSDIAIQQAKLETEINTITSGYSEQVLQNVLASYGYALKNYPHRLLYNHFADVHEKTTGNYPLAEEYYQKAVDEYPHDTTSLDLLAKIKLLLGKYSEAEELFRKVLASEPSDPQRKVNLAVVIGSQERYDDAVKLLRDVVADSEYLESAYFNLAVYLFNQDSNKPANQKESLKYWRLVLGNNPDHIEARYGLANIYQRQGKTTQSIKELNKILETEPNHQPSRELLKQLK